VQVVPLDEMCIGPCSYDLSVFNLGWKINKYRGSQLL